LDSGESIFDGAVREAKEETGYDVRLDSVLCIQYLENKQLLKIIFNATIVSGSISFDENEIMDVRWIPIEDLENMTENELRSYDSNIKIIDCVKKGMQYPLNIIENL
jgi:NADH pyrophosphatase NudC (nudix superfamily)